MPPTPPATKDLIDSVVDERWTSSAAGVSLWHAARQSAERATRPEVFGTDHGYFASLGGERVGGGKGGPWRGAREI